MKLKANAPKIDPSNPFAEDSIGRKVQADTLTKIIQDIREPFVLAVDAPFGMGKSTFIQMWGASLKAQGFVTLHFNAWENDFTENALVALLGEFRQELEKDENNTKATSVWNKAIKAGGVVARASVPALIKVLTASAVDMDKIGEAIASAAEKAAEKGIENYEKDKQTIQAFKDDLGRFINEKTPTKPLIFFIDELDRCRPLFAIEVLEHAKHLFNVEGIVFVLGVNKTQLGHSVKAVYGADLDLNGYFGRLIDVTYALPQPEIALFVEGIHRRLVALTTVMNQQRQAINSEDVGLIQAAAALLGEQFQIPLRTIEQLYAQVLLTWKILTEPVNPVLVLGLIFVREHDRQMFDNFFKRVGDLGAFMNQFKKMRERHVNSIRGVAATELHCLFRLLAMPEAEVMNFRSTSRAPGYKGWEQEDFINVRKRCDRFILDERQRLMVLKSILLTQPFAIQVQANITLDLTLIAAVQTEPPKP